MAEIRFYCFALAHLPILRNWQETAEEQMELLAANGCLLCFYMRGRTLSLTSIEQFAARRRQKDKECEEGKVEAIQSSEF
jgi:hypothetical protein